MSKIVSEGKIQRQITLPLSQAFQICLRGIRIRFARSLITAAGIFLGIAFLMSVFTSAEVIRVVEETVEKAAKEAAQARQIWLVAMSLIVCTVGIANSMLMSVTERFKEIGTMKCLGALDSFIVKLFLLESGLLGFLGSLGGAVLGFLVMGLIYSIKLSMHFAIFAKINMVSILLHICISIVIGTFLAIIAAVFPSWRAAKIPAAAALRVEV